jgi:ribonuclease HII
VTPSERARLERLHQFEKTLWAEGLTHIAGIDEVGRGPLAGPVVAACVVIEAPLLLVGLNDSKKVSEPRRRSLALQIAEAACAYAIGSASVAEIDTYSIGKAVKLAMRRALDAVRVKPDAVLIDALYLPSYPGLQRAIIGGDAKSAVIAAASITAKVHRDALLTTLDSAYPAYGFARHKGYGTAAHLAALQAHGPTPHHRRSFAPVRTAYEATGARAEEVAVFYLRGLGYRILGRNVRTPEGEIDVVALDGATVAFIEVKMRRTRRFGSAVSAVDMKKRRRIRESAANYMQFLPEGQKTIFRFDVVTIEHGIATLLRDAF